MAHQRTRHFINGEYTEGSSDKTFENRCPIDNSLSGHVCEANRADVDAAVRAARANRVAQQVRVGLAWINCWFLRDLRTPFGGAKQSGIGREGGVHSLEFYTELRNVCLKL